MASFRFAWSIALSLLALGCASRGVAVSQSSIPPTGSAPDQPGDEGAAHGFPVLRDLSGRTLADGDFTQWLEGGRLHIRIRYEFGADHWVEERSVLQQQPALVQESWSWTEVSQGAIQRHFDVDFRKHKANAEKLEDGELRRWTEDDLSIEPGRAFAGSAWSLAIREVRGALLRGETIEFQTVGFTPKPRAATVSISHVSLDQVPMAGRSLMGDRFRIHPLIPWYAKPFVDVPDSSIWLAHATPAAFLRWEGPLGEPKGQLVRVDLLPGDPSEAASPWTSPNAPGSKRSPRSAARASDPPRTRGKSTS